MIQPEVPLGGGSADAVNFIREAVRAPSIENRPSQGGRSPGLPDVRLIDKKAQAEGRFVEFKLVPEQLKLGYVSPGGLFAGQKFRVVVSQRLLGWSLNRGTDGNGQTWDGVPADGFTGKLPVGIPSVDGLPIVTVNASEAR